MLQQAWQPDTKISPDHQFQLPDSLYQDWPFDIGQGDAFFEFMGDWGVGSWNGTNGGELGLSGGEVFGDGTPSSADQQLLPGLNGLGHEYQHV